MLKKEELIEALEKAKKQLLVAKENDEIDFAKKKIAKLENQIKDYKVSPSEAPKPKEKKIRGKGIKSLLKDKPVKDLTPDCDELLENFKKTAAKKRKASKKYAEKPVSKKVEDTLEKTAETIEKKTKDLKDDGKGLSESTIEKLESYTTSFINSIQEVIKDEADRKEFIKTLISKLEKML